MLLKIDHDYDTALLRCRQLEEQWRRSQSLPRPSVTQRLLRAGKPLVRRGLRANSRLVDNALGRAQTIGNIADFAAHCGDVDLISFDVFDTLVYRTVEPPDFLKRHSANFAAQLLAGYGLPLHRDLFLYVRGEEEARLRRRALTRGLDSECKLSELLHAAVKSLCGLEIADRETATLVRYELDVECQHLRVAVGVAALLSSLQLLGKRIVAVSDTYLESQHLEHVLNHLGIKSYFNSVYVSADHGVGKYSGRLFETVLRAERTRPERMVHIADNYESDVRGAIRSGVRAVFLRDRRRLQSRQKAGRVSAAIAGGGAKALAVTRENAANHKKLTGQDKEVFQIGHDILGPAFFAFVLRVIEECYRWRVSAIYFLAREGYLLKQIHGLLVRNIHRHTSLPRIPARYLYVSRLATTLPALNTSVKRSLQLAQFRNPDAGLDESLRTFGLTLDDVEDLIYSMDIDNPNAVGQLFADPRFAARVRQLAGPARQRLKAYLAQEGFFDRDKRHALVDIGWSATIQANLTRAFHRDDDFPTVIGLYFGRRYAHEDDYALSPRSQFSPGVMFDDRRVNAAEHAIDRCVEIFEISTSAPHGATLDYRDSEGKVTPLLHDAPMRLTREQEMLQDGILTFVEKFSQRYNEYEPDTEVLLCHAVKGLERFICRPTADQVAALSEVQHSIDWGSQAFRPLIAKNLTLASVVKPAHLLATLRHCCWPEGSLRHSRIPGGLILLSLLRRTLRSRQNLRKVARLCANLFRGKVRRPSETVPGLVAQTEIAGASEKDPV